ncbi:hypothetical protein [Phaeodactylibacter xiamenensis]|uniref:hypothetical protein n=1 Tax=Phaeodactylibacter xiamenensis TaxID=1524460 RepID=UPI0024A82258|nr:hypothetical protein [Phaeodactylibacter xiamenensis]
MLGWSCEKEALPAPAITETDASPEPSIVFRSEKDSVPTILGAQRNNPYTVSNMTQAWNNLFGQHKTYAALPATHQYVKFDPQSLEEYKALAESGITYVDFPLGYEVVQLGDYYPQEGLGPEVIPDFYGVLEAGEPVPAVTYQVLEDLVIPPYETPLTARAFEQVGGLSSYFEGLGGTGVSAIPDPCGQECPNYPNCFYFPQHFGCSGPPTYNGDCTPDSPDWPDCLVIYDDEEEELNDCGCPVPGDVRMPAGCIQVQDVERNGLFPVEAVRVVWWNGWFTFKTAETDARGCWQIKDHREHGKAYMWVSFRNDRARLRGFVGNTVQVWRLLATVTDYGGELGGGSYNNIQTEYNLWNNQGGRDHRNWSAATVMNALHHFHTESQNDGINPPPMGLDIYLTAYRRDGIALMTSQIPVQLLEQWINQGLFNSQLLPNVINSLLVIPDVAIGCNFQNSDRQWAITQHELAHTSHFTNVGAEYWGALGLATLTAFQMTSYPWGWAGVPDAGRIAICESWASHLEHVYTDRAYGGNNSWALANTWQTVLEETRNDSPNHVPIGLHFDLFDNMPDVNNACDRDGGGCGPIVDNVAGFTNGQLFSVLDENTTDPGIYQNRILNDLLPGSGVMAADVNALFNSY